MYGCVAIRCSVATDVDRSFQLFFSVLFSVIPSSILHSGSSTIVSVGCFQINHRARPAPPARPDRVTEVVNLTGWRIKAGLNLELVGVEDSYLDDIRKLHLQVRRPFAPWPTGLGGPLWPVIV